LTSLVIVQLLPSIRSSPQIKGVWSVEKGLDSTGTPFHSRLSICTSSRYSDEPSCLECKCGA